MTNGTQPHPVSLSSHYVIDPPSCQPVLERAVTPIDVLADQAYDTGVARRARGRDGGSPHDPAGRARRPRGDPMRQREKLPRDEKLRRGTSVLVTTPTFTAGLVIYRGGVVTCSPILKRWVGVRHAADALDRLAGTRVARGVHHEQRGGTETR